MEKIKLNAFVTNLGKYNEGQLVGEWVSFPTTYEEMQAVFDRIGLDNQYEEYFITDYDCSISNISNALGEYVSVDRLNYLAGRLEELDDFELEKFEEVVSSGIDLYQQNGIDAYINLTYNLDTYEFYSGVENESDLGYYIVHEIGGYNMDAMGELANYIDYEALGRDTVINDMCAFSDNGYVVYDNSSWCIEFDGKQASIPDEYRITGNGKMRESKEQSCQSEESEQELSEPEDLDMSVEEMEQLEDEMMLEAQKAEMSQGMGLVR